MPYVIRRKSTGTFLRKPRSWSMSSRDTSDINKARVYGRIGDASNSVHIAPEGDYEVVEVTLVEVTG